MSVSRTSSIAALMTLLVVAGTWFFTRQAKISAPAQAPIPPRTKSIGARTPPRPSPALTPAAVAKIPAEEWRTRFLTEYQDVDPELRVQVVMLAGELEKSVAAGLDPASEEARAYGETIILLLAEKHAAP